MLSQEKVKQRASAYLNDIYMNEDIVSLIHIRMKLAKFGLICKDPERLENSARVLGLDIHGEQGTLQWRHGTAVQEVPDFLTRPAVFSLFDRLMEHLRVVASTISRRTSIVTKGWDDETTDTVFVRMVTETIARVKSDPVRGDWCVLGKEMNVWVDVGVLLEKNGAVIEDAC